MFQSRPLGCARGEVSKSSGGGGGWGKKMATWYKQSTWLPDELHRISYNSPFWMHYALSLCCVISKMSTSLTLIWSRSYRPAWQCFRTDDDDDDVSANISCKFGFSVFYTSLVFMFTYCRHKSAVSIRISHSTQPWNIHSFISLNIHHIEEIVKFHSVVMGSIICVA